MIKKFTIIIIVDIVLKSDKYRYKIYKINKIIMLIANLCTRIFMGEDKGKKSDMISQKERRSFGSYHKRYCRWCWRLLHHGFQSLKRQRFCWRIKERENTWDCPVLGGGSQSGGCYLKKSISLNIGLCFSTIFKSTSPYILHDVLILVYNVRGSGYHMIVSDWHAWAWNIKSKQFAGLLIMSQGNWDEELV